MAEQEEIPQIREDQTCKYRSSMHIRPQCLCRIYLWQGGRMWPGCQIIDSKGKPGQNDAGQKWPILI